MMMMMMMGLFYSSLVGARAGQAACTHIFLLILEVVYVGVCIHSNVNTIHQAFVGLCRSRSTFCVM